MELTVDEREVLGRYREKTRQAGGARLGYLLRRVAIAKGVDDSVDLDTALSGLAGRGLVATSESGEFVFLTEAGIEAVDALAG